MYNMHLIINTHWDREYRWSFSETQFRLAGAVDDQPVFDAGRLSGYSSGTSC